MYCKVKVFPGERIKCGRDRIPVPERIKCGRNRIPVPERNKRVQKNGSFSLGTVKKKGF